LGGGGEGGVGVEDAVVCLFEVLEGNCGLQERDLWLGGGDNGWAGEV